MLYTLTTGYFLRRMKQNWTCDCVVGNYGIQFSLFKKDWWTLKKLIFDADTCTDFLGNIKRNSEKVALDFFKVRRNWQCILSKLLAYLRVPRNWMSVLLFCNFAFKSYNTGTSRFGSKLKMNWHCHLFRNKTPRRLTQFAILVNVRKTLLVLIHLSLSVMFETGTCMYVVKRFYDDSHHPKRYFCTGSSFVSSENMNVKDFLCLRLKKGQKP